MRKLRWQVWWLTRHLSEQAPYAYRWVQRLRGATLCQVYGHQVPPGPPLTWKTWCQRCGYVP